MFEAAAFTYSLLAGFILSSAARNKRQQRPHSRLIVIFGSGLMSLSLTFGVLMLGWALWQALRG